MSDLKRLITREVQASAGRARIRGTIITAPELRTFDPNGGTAPTFVCSVDIGADRILREVPVKINGPKARFYAQPGFAVYLDRNAQGRYQVVAPADRITQPANITEIDEDTNLAESAGQSGVTIVRQPYIYYAGDGPELLFNPATDPDTLLWVRAYDRAIGAPANIVVSSDVDGADVLQLTAKSPTTVSFIQNGVEPLYRRFDSLFSVTTRSSVDFDGLSSGMDATANVTESSAGQISIFMLVNKDATGGGADALLELANIRVLSRRSAGDSWGIDVGSGQEDSGSQLLTPFVLLEVIATNYSNIALYQSGVLLQTITTAAAGLGLGASSLGYSAAAAAGSHNGRIAEVLVLDRTVNAADRLAIEGYFNRTAFEAFSRWGDPGYPKISIYNAQGVEI